MTEIELRCPNCNKLLFKAFDVKLFNCLGYIEVKCPRCKEMCNFDKDNQKTIASS